MKKRMLDRAVAAVGRKLRRELPDGRLLVPVAVERQRERLPGARAGRSVVKPAWYVDGSVIWQGVGRMSRSPPSARETLDRPRPPE